MPRPTISQLEQAGRDGQRFSVDALDYPEADHYDFQRIARVCAENNGRLTLRNADKFSSSQQQTIARYGGVDFEFGNSREAEKSPHP